MVLDLNIKGKTMRRMVYVLGAIIEVVGLALLFNFSETINFIQTNSTLFSLLLIIGGYVAAVGARKIR